MVFQKENDKFLASIAVKNNLDMDRILSAYLIMGDLTPLILHVFEGQTFHVPSKRKLQSPILHSINFIEDDERKYVDMEKDEVINYKGIQYMTLGKEQKILNHYYIPVMKYEG